MLVWWRQLQPSELKISCAPIFGAEWQWQLYFYDDEPWRYHPAHAKLMEYIDKRMVREIRAWVQRLVVRNAQRSSPLTIVYEERMENETLTRGILFTWK